MAIKYATTKTKMVVHLVERLHCPTRLKVQNGLYLLWAYYAGSYGQVDQEFGDYPKDLFEPNFHAGKYGVFDPDVDVLLKKLGVK